MQFNCSIILRWGHCVWNTYLIAGSNATDLFFIHWFCVQKLLTLYLVFFLNRFFLLSFPSYLKFNFYKKKRVNKILRCYSNHHHRYNGHILLHLHVIYTINNHRRHHHHCIPYRNIYCVHLSGATFINIHCSHLNWAFYTKQ